MVMGAFMGGGTIMVPKGKCLLHLHINTIDRANLSTASWTITATGKSYTATADSSGRADILVDADASYTITLNHDGEYYNDEPQYVNATSCGVAWIYFDLFQYPDVSTVLQVYTEPSTQVTIVSGTNTQVKTSDSNGLAQFNGLASGSVWTVSANGKSATVTIEHLLTVVTVGKMPIYGVKIARTGSDPSARVTYINDAEGFTQIVNSGNSFNMGSWDGNDLISGIKPMSKSGSVWTELDKRTLSGCPTSTAADALVEIPTWYLSFDNDDDYIYVRFSEKKQDDTYDDLASRLNGERIGMFHWGMFHGLISSSKLYSYSGVTPTVSQSITNFSNYAKARGTGYDLITYYQAQYLIALMVLLFKTTDLQSALGKGLTNSGSAAQSRSKLTFTNDYGMYGSTTDYATCACFFWIHDIWGNIFDFVGCAKTDSSSRLMTIIDGYSSVTESDFTLVTPNTPTGTRGGWVSDVVGTTGAGFLPKTCSGSSSTFWCDRGYVYASHFPYWGGGWSDSDDAGPFYWRFSNSATSTSGNIGSRLSYRSGRA